MHDISNSLQGSRYEKVTPNSRFRDSSDDNESATDGLLGDGEGRALPKPKSFLGRWWVLILAHIVLLFVYLGILGVVYRSAKIAGGIGGPNLVFCQYKISIMLGQLANEVLSACT